MAALNVTASQVIAPTDGSGVFRTGVAGVNTTNTIKLADSNASQATAAVIGIVTHGVLTGQPVEYQSGVPTALGLTDFTDGIEGD